MLAQINDKHSRAIPYFEFWQKILESYLLKARHIGLFAFYLWILLKFDVDIETCVPLMLLKAAGIIVYFTFKGINTARAKCPHLKSKQIS